MTAKAGLCVTCKQAKQRAVLQAEWHCLHLLACLLIVEENIHKASITTCKNFKK